MNTNLIGQILLNRYRVDSLLGRGGMGDVYKVWDNQRGVFLAMKVLHADLAEDRVFLRRFAREAETLSALQHPHIVRFYGLEQEGRLTFILMDYVDGATLRGQIFDTHQPFTLEQVLQIMRPVCSALHYAHQMGRVHCDIKPANIMVKSNGDVLVADFGIARMMESSTTTTMAGAGTPAYMAPEQALGKNPVPQTDIYALGVVLYEMLTGGERPFTGEQAQIQGSTSEKVRWEQITLNPPSLRKYNPHISLHVEAVILKCLQKKLEERYADAFSLLNALSAESKEQLPELVEVTELSPALPSLVKKSEGIKRDTRDKPIIRRKKQTSPISWLIGGTLVMLGLLFFINTFNSVPLTFIETSAPTETKNNIAELAFTPTAIFTPTVIPLLVPTPVPIDAVYVQQNLYQDDFSNSNSGWPVASDADKAVSYNNGQYLMQAITAKQDIWAHPCQSLTDVSISVDATKSAGPENNDFGIVCRFVDDNNFYFFMVSSDGYQAIGKYLDGKFSYLSADKMQQTTAVKSGNAVNNLRADCNGSTLTLYANGQMLSTVTDTSFTTGDVGLLVGTFDEPNVSVLFDNFVVTKP